MVSAAGKICKKEELRVVYHGRVRERFHCVCQRLNIPFLRRGRMSDKGVGMRGGGS